MRDEATVLDRTREGNQSREFAEIVAASQQVLLPLLKGARENELGAQPSPARRDGDQHRARHEAVRLAEALGDETTRVHFPPRLRHWRCWLEHERARYRKSRSRCSPPRNLIRLLVHEDCARQAQADSRGALVPGGFALVGSAA